MKRYDSSLKSHFVRLENCILLFFVLTALMFANPLISNVYAKTQRLVDHVILIIPDGFSPDYMAMYDLPNLRSLANNGVFFARAKGVFPPNSTPNHASILTGTYPEQTSLPNNTMYDREKDRIYGELRDIQVPTLPEILHAEGMVTVEQNHFLLGNRKAISYSHGVDNFKRAMTAHKPDLLIYLEKETDAQGHRVGPYNMKETLLQFDSDLGEMLAYLEEAGIRDKTAVIIASDHGMIETSLPGVAPQLLEDLKDAGFSVADSNSAIEDNTDIVAIRTGSLFLYCREGRIDKTKYDTIMSIVETIPNAHILTEKELRARHTDPYALGDIVIAPQPGYVISTGGGGGVHGVPETQRTTLILSGAGFREGQIQGRANTVDIAPTILYLLGVEVPDTMDGEVLKGAIMPPKIDWGSVF